jgi:DNA (cytosine-5)-methyltransferase 1
VSKRYKKDFDKWLEFLSSLGYHNYYKVLNSKDYGVAQNRQRLFCISSLKEIDYKFPEPYKYEGIKPKLIDYLEDEKYVDEKLYLKDSWIAYKFKFRQELDLSEYILIPEATIKGYNKAFLGDGVYINRPHQKRGVVQRNCIQTLKTTNSDVGVVVKRKGESEKLCIRKLTVRETYRLMGWSDENIDKIVGLRGISDTALYRLSGNAIVIQVLKELFNGTYFI